MESQVNQNGNNVKEESLIYKFTVLLKNRWKLMAIILAVFILLGVGYSYLKKPSYTAVENTTFTTKITEGSGSANDYENTQKFFGTMIDFCTQGVVIDRANYYYQKYVDLGYAKNNDINGYLDAIKQVKVYDVNVDRNPSINHIQKSKIRVKSAASSELHSLTLEIRYTDASAKVAIAKAKILTYAINEESKEKIVVGQNQNGTGGVEWGKYFIAPPNLSDDGLIAVYSNVSKIKNIFVFALLGIVVAFAVAVITMKLDISVKSKEELEEITGANLLATIEYIKEEKDSGKYN